MRNLRVITSITLLLLAMSATNILAQHKPAVRTRGAKAAYGYPTEKFTAKKKRKKQRKAKKTKSKQQPLYRKKDPWAG